MSKVTYPAGGYLRSFPMDGGEIRQSVNPPFQRDWLMEHAEVFWGKEAGDDGPAGVGCAGDEVFPLWG